MPSKTGFLAPCERSTLWERHKLTEKNLIEAAERLPAERRREFDQLFDPEPDIEKIDRLAALAAQAPKAPKKV